MLLEALALCAATLAVSTLLLLLLLRRQMAPRDGSRVTVAFFHPYCHAGGGGERVLWAAVMATAAAWRERGPGEARQLDMVIYSGDVPADGVDEEEQAAAIVARARARFDLAVDRRALRFVFLRQRRWVEAKTYPRLTLLGQSLGSLVLAAEALARCYPHVWIDTMGYAFAYPLVRLLGGATVVSYTHYPTVSGDMLATAPSRAKLYYWRLFARVYGAAGRMCHVPMVNSSWTAGHVREIWRVDNVRVVFPPCPTENLRKLSVVGRPGTGKRAGEPRFGLSVAQFRPEKAHGLQLDALAALIGDARDGEFDDVVLTLAGGCRGDEDEARVDALKRRARELGIEKHVEFKINVPYPELEALMARSVFGLHTMWMEHFGIGVVEYMAAGMICLAHDSGGPKADIVVDVQGKPTGFRATSKDEYAASMRTILRMSDGERETMVRRARAHVATFSDEAFADAWRSAMALVPQLQ